MTRILVTGGAGRLGRSVVDGLIAEGNEVVSIDRVRRDDSLAVQHIVDLSHAGSAYETIARVRPDSVVHLAAIAVPFSAPEHQILATNASLAFNVMQAAADLGVKRVITASSPTVLGYGAPGSWVPTRLPLDEESIPLPWNAYALSKLLAEQIAAMLARKSAGATRFASFRPCFVIAPEEWEGAPTQQGHSVRERLNNPALSAPALFNYVDSRDAAGFVGRLLDALPEIPNAETFFVGAADALAREPLSELLPRFVPGTEKLAAELTGTRPAFSVAKAERLLGWVPQYSWRTELSDATFTPSTLETV